MANLDDDAATAMVVERNWSGIDGGSVASMAVAFPECICSDLQHDDYSPLYAWFNYIIIIIMLPSLSVFGIITNCVNVFIFSRKRMRNSANTYLFFLACSDFMVIITGLFIFWIDSARSYINALSQAPYTTVYTLPFGYMAQTCSVYFTVAAAFDCYIAVCWRRAAFHYCTPRRARQINGCIVFCSIVYNSLRFPQFNLRKCFHDGSQELILEICPTSLFFAINTVYNVYMYMVLMTVLPFFLLLMLNALIIIRKSLDTTRKSRKTSTEKKYLRSEVVAVAATKTTASLTNGSTPPPPPSANYRGSIPSTIYTGNSVAISDYHFHRHQHHDRDRDSQVEIGLARRARSGSHASSQHSGKVSTDDSITMIMVVVLFLSCNTLAIIVNVIETFFEPDALLLNLLSDTSNFLVVFNSSVNCVIYMIFNAEYRELFLIYFLKVKEHNCFRQFCTRVTALSSAATTTNCRSAAGQGVTMAQQQRSRLLYQPQQRTMVEKFLSNNEDGGGDGENGSLMREGCGGAGDDQDQFIMREDAQSPIWLQYTQQHQHQQQHTSYRRGSKTLPTVYESRIGEAKAAAGVYCKVCAATIPQSATQLSFEPSDVELLQLVDDDDGDEMAEIKNSTVPLFHLLSSDQRHNKVIRKNDGRISVAQCCPMHCPLQCQSSHCPTIQLPHTNTAGGRTATAQLPITAADNNNNSRSTASSFHHRPHIYVRPFPREEQLPNDISNGAVMVTANKERKKDEFHNDRSEDNVEQRMGNNGDGDCDSNNDECDGGFSFTEI